jgi:integrase
MRKECPHGVLLPRGLKCDRGYLSLRLKQDGRWIPQRGLGPHTPTYEKAARLILDDIRLKQKFGTFAIPVKSKRLKFKDVAWMFFRQHFELWRDPTTHAPRSHSSILNTKYMIKYIVEYFGEFYFDAIKPKDVKEFKTDVVEFDDLAPGTFNRRKGLLSSMFTAVTQWVKTEEMEAIKLPPENPCDFVPDLEETPRKRLASRQELSAIKKACLLLGLPQFWNLIYISLDTNVRLGDLESVLAAEAKEGFIEIKQHKTGRAIMMPALEQTKQAVYKARRYRWEQVRAKASEILIQEGEMPCHDLQWRDLRKTGINMLEGLGASVQNQQDAAGHASSKTTERHYRQAKPVALVALSEAKRKILDSL